MRNARIIRRRSIQRERRVQLVIISRLVLIIPLAILDLILSKHAQAAIQNAAQIRRAALALRLVIPQNAQALAQNVHVEPSLFLSSRMAAHAHQLD